MKAWRELFVATFDSRSLRERVLISLAVCALTWGVWDISIGGIVTDQKVDVIRDIDRLARELSQQDAERQRLRSLDRNPEREALKQQQLRLDSILLAQADELDALLARFVAPEDVPKLLADVLQNHGGLKLVRLTSQPAQPITVSVDGQSGGDPADGAKVHIYRHPVQIEFEGGYLDVLAYLESLENVGWQFAWRQLEYAVVEHPNAQIIIELETLSREKEWLGV